MSVDIGQAIEEGGRRTLARNGLIFVAIVWVLGVVNGIFSNTVARDMFRNFPAEIPGGPPAVGPTVGISPAVAGLLSLVVGLITIVVSAAAIRTFVTEETETIPDGSFTRNLLWMVLNLVVGGIVFGIVVAIGFVFLVLPGLFLLVSLFFWNVYVVVEDENFVEAFGDSWALTKGNRILLFVLGVIVVIAIAVVNGIFGLANSVLPGVVGLAIAQVGSAFASVFAIATAARTYRQLTVAEATDETIPA